MLSSDERVLKWGNVNRFFCRLSLSLSHRPLTMNAPLSRWSTVPGTARSTANTTTVLVTSSSSIISFGRLLAAFGRGCPHTCSLGARALSASISDSALSTRALSASRNESKDPLLPRHKCHVLPVLFISSSAPRRSPHPVDPPYCSYQDHHCIHRAPLMLHLPPPSLRSHSAFPQK